MTLSRVFRNLSATIRKDPSRTKRMTQAYEAALLKPFDGLKERIVEELKGIRALEKVALFISPKEVDEKLRVLFERSIIQGTDTELRKYIRQLYDAGMLRSSDFMASVGIVGAIGGPLDLKVLQVLIERNAQFVQGMTDDLRKRIVDEISDSMLKGEGPEKMAKRIDESLDIGRERARVIARTESMYAFNTAAKANYERNGVTRVRWLTAYENVCPECIAMEGQEFPIDDAPDCPLHPQCRCVLLPVIEEVPNAG